MGIKFCKASDEAPVDYEAYKEGWLNNGSSFIDGANRKYVVLCKNPCALMAYKDDSKKSDETFAYFCLQDVDFSFNSESFMLRFKRKRGGKETWSFMTKDEKEFREWVNGIEEIMIKSKSSIIKTNWTIGSTESKQNE